MALSIEAPYPFAADLDNLREKYGLPDSIQQRTAAIRISCAASGERYHHVKDVDHEGMVLMGAAMLLGKLQGNDDAGAQRGDSLAEKFAKHDTMMYSRGTMSEMRRFAEYGNEKVRLKDRLG